MISLFVYTQQPAFDLKMRTEKVGGNRKTGLLSVVTEAWISAKKNFEVGGVKERLYKLETRSKTANIAKVNIEKVAGSI